jgi:HPt (histidine-containing phosphotransfer) domain-containing protein/CheY-like chemotaxis protein
MEAQEQPVGGNGSDGLDLWLVNDDPAQLMVQQRLLSRVAATVEVFLSPMEALAAARVKGSSRFLVTDFHMPVMDGPELARYWCDLHRDARVLVVSASEVNREEQARMDALPRRSVRLLTSYRITDLQEEVKVWFLDHQSSDAASLKDSSPVMRLDSSVLDKLAIMGGAAFLARTITRFLQNGPEKVEGIRSAYLAQNHEKMHELAHALKGSCGLVGALLLSRAADEIENATSEGGDTSLLEQQLQTLRDECAATVQELEKLRG